MRAILCFLLITSVAVHSKGQVTIENFLQSSTFDHEVKTIEEQVNYLQENPYKISYLQKLEVRIQNRELLPDQQSYGLRISPTNPWEVKYNNQYFKEYQSVLFLQKELMLKKAFMKRYEKVVEYLYLTELRDISLETEKLIHNSLTIHERQSGSSFFDPEKYSKLKVSEIGKTVELEELEFKLSDLINEIQTIDPECFNKKLLWDYRSVISINKIKYVMDSLSSETATPIVLTYLQQNINLETTEYKLEKANINPGFIQTTFDQRRIYENRTPFNISLGITIPIVNPNKGDMARKQLKIIEGQNELEKMRAEAKFQQQIQREKFYKLFERYNNLEQEIKKLKDGKFINTVQTIKGENPLIGQELNEDLLKLQVLLIKLKQSIMLSYLEYLDVVGVLQSTNMVNFLSEKLEKI